MIPVLAAAEKNTKNAAVHKQKNWKQFYRVLTIANRVFLRLHWQMLATKPQADSWFKIGGIALIG